MSRAVPNINGVRLLAILAPVVSGSNVIAGATYAVGWTGQQNGAQYFHDAPNWLLKGKGQITVTVPMTTSYAQIDQAVVGAIVAAEGLGTGDQVISTDGTVTTL